MRGRNFPVENPAPPLQYKPWPPVGPFAGFPAGFERFLRLTPEGQRRHLRRLRQTPDRHGAFLHRGLAANFAYDFGYEDSPLYMATDDDLEARLGQAKIALVSEMFNYWLRPQPVEPAADQTDLVRRLRTRIESNRGLTHGLFDFLAEEAPETVMTTFLLNDVARNEIVDDEVALLVVGHQGQLKSMAAVNLFDEVGRGKLQHAHTYWLRQLLEKLGAWDELAAYRRAARPWYCSVTSNVFAALLTRPGWKFAAYGHFLVTESWVESHFLKIIRGMRRLGLDDEDALRYFTAHAKIDPFHTEELLVGLERQVPSLTPKQMELVLWGAEAATAGATRQYELMLAEYRTPAAHPSGGGEFLRFEQ